MPLSSSPTPSLWIRALLSLCVASTSLLSFPTSLHGTPQKAAQQPAHHHTNTTGAQTLSENTQAPPVSPPLFTPQEHGTYLSQPSSFSLGMDVTVGSVRPTKTSQDPGLMLLFSSHMGYTKYLPNFGAYYLGIQLSNGTLNFSTGSVHVLFSSIFHGGYLFHASKDYGFAVYAGTGLGIGDYQEKINNIEFSSQDPQLGLLINSKALAYLYATEALSLQFGLGLRYYEFYLKDLSQNPNQSTRPAASPEDGDSLRFYAPFAHFGLQYDL